MPKNPAPRADLRPFSPASASVEVAGRSRSIPVALTDIQDALSDLDSRLGELSARLVPVLTDPIPIEEQPSPGAVCGLAYDLQDIHRRIRCQFLALTAIVERLEL